MFLAACWFRHSCPQGLSTSCLVFSQFLLTYWTWGQFCFSHRSAQSWPRGLLHLCDTWWVWNCRMPILLQCACSQHFSVWTWEMLSTARWMWNIQAFWGLFAVGVVFQEGLIRCCFWYSLCYVTQGKDANVSTCCVLPPAPKFSISYWLNVSIYAVSTAAKCARIYVRKNET